jgi:hypothetical protein
LDALAEICRRYLGSPDAPMTGGGHAHLIVSTDSTTLTHPHGTSTRPHDGGSGLGGDLPGAGGAGEVLDWGVGLGRYPLPGTGTTSDGTTSGGTATSTCGAGPGGMLSWVGPIAGSTARRVGCDADVTYVQIDDRGEATLLGREARFFSWAQRKAMIARDGDRCAVPFYDRPIAWADGHHLLDWSLGGPTSIGNGALPCAGHHTLCHEGGWALIRLPDGALPVPPPRRQDHRPRTVPIRPQPATPTQPAIPTQPAVTDTVPRGPRGQSGAGAGAESPSDSARDQRDLRAPRRQ